MRTNSGIVLAGVACAAVLAACGSREKSVAPTGEPAEQPVTQPRDIPVTPPAPATADGHSRWNTYHGGASLDGVADAQLPDELELRWRFKAAAPVRTTPVAGSGHICFVNTEGRLFAVDLQGNEVWSRTIPRDVTDSWSPPEERFDAPLAFFDDTLLAGSVNGVLFALDASTGGIRWQADVDGTILGSANVAYGGAATADGGRVFVIEQSAGALHCFDFRTGQSIWRAEDVDRCDGPAGVGAGTVVFGSCAGALHVFSANSGGLLREIAIDDDSQVAGGVVIQGDAVFSGSRSGKVLQANTKTGGLVWVNADSGDEVFTTPAVNNAWVVFGAADGKVYALDRASGHQRWSFSTDGAVTSPVLAGDKVVVASDGVLFLLRLADGQPLWSYPVSDEVTSPAVLADMVVVGSDDGTVAAFG